MSEADFWRAKILGRAPPTIEEQIRFVAASPTIEVDRELVRVIVGNVTDEEWAKIRDALPLGIDLRRTESETPTP